MAWIATVIMTALPVVARAATYDLNGRWQIVSTNSQIEGDCQPGTDFTTFATLVQSGDTFSFDLETSTGGGTCSPPALCQLHGGISGSGYQATSGFVPVDYEGFPFNEEATVSFVATGPDSASGSSAFHSFGELTCNLTQDIALTRVPEPASALATATAFLALFAQRGMRPRSRRDG